MDDSKGKPRTANEDGKPSISDDRGRQIGSNSHERKPNTSAERDDSDHRTQDETTRTSGGCKFSPRKGSLEKCESQEALESIFINQIEHNSEETEVLAGPSALIVSHVPLAVFNEQSHKAGFEELFNAFNDQPHFLYLKSFSRARVEYSTPKAACRARAQLNNQEFLSGRLKVFFAQMPDSPSSQSAASQYLEVPKPHRQFLISPPASPPVGWEQLVEGEPVLNHDLLAALAHLAPGDKHELHEPEQSSHPAIVLHVASADPSPSKLHVESAPPLAGNRIQQTRCPPRAS